MHSIINNAAGMITYDKNKIAKRFIAAPSSTEQKLTTFDLLEDEYYIRTSNRLPNNFSVIINQDYDMILGRINSIDATLSSIDIPEKVSISTISPHKVYTTCNDISIWSENFSQKSIVLYVERLLNLDDKRYCNFESTQGLSRSLSSRRYYHPLIS